MQRSPRFIEVHPDGSATLKYPGHEARQYKSANAAYNRRKQIDSGKVSRALFDRPQCLRNWSEAEKAIVRERWGVTLKAEWTRLLPGRTYEAIKSRARDEKVWAADNARRQPPEARRSGTPIPWTPDELETIRSHTRSEAIALLSVKRTRTAVLDRAKRLGVPADGPHKPWTSIEIEILENNPRDLAVKLLGPNRSLLACKRKATSLGLRKTRDNAWSAEEIAMVYNNDRETARQLLAPRRRLNDVARHDRRRSRALLSPAPMPWSSPRRGRIHRPRVVTPSPAACERGSGSRWPAGDEIDLDACVVGEAGDAHAGARG